MSYLTDLLASREGISAKLAALYADPKPTYSVDGRSWSWDQHRASLLKELADVNKLIIQATGAMELRSIALG